MKRALLVIIAVLATDCGTSPSKTAGPVYVQAKTERCLHSHRVTFGHSKLEALWKVMPTGVTGAIGIILGGKIGAKPIGAQIDSGALVFFASPDLADKGRAKVRDFFANNLFVQITPGTRSNSHDNYLVGNVVVDWDSHQHPVLSKRLVATCLAASRA